MWKMSKRLAACVFAAAWWGIFYPELCLSEETCVRVQTETVQETEGETQGQTVGPQEENEEAPRKEGVQKRGEGQQSGLKEIDAADVWRASGDEIVIRSRLWEWCVENLFDASKNAAQSVSEESAQSAPAGR